MTQLLPIQKAQEMILAALPQPRVETCPIAAACGRVLAEDVFSPLDLPPFDNSSMDGFAVCSAELTALPMRLPVSADIPAGASQVAPLAAGSAARILTGAVMPPGADAVIPVEDTDAYAGPQNAALPDSVEIRTAVKAGANVRRKGEDVRRGEPVLAKGQLLRPQDVGMLVSLGMSEVKVFKRARVALLSSGDELLEPGQPIVPGRIYDANRFMLAGLLESAGAEVITPGIARDTLADVTAKLEQACAAQPDLIVSSAGVSVGAFDYVREAVEARGSLSFWRVNMRPGKPIAFGEYRGIPFIGLPGNPVSAYIGCQVFVLPAVRQLHGRPPTQRRLVQALLDEPLRSADGRESYYRGVVRRDGELWRGRLTGHQGSGNLLSLVQANALLIVPAGVAIIEAGQSVSAWLLDSDEPG